MIDSTFKEEIFESDEEFEKEVADNKGRNMGH
jgi:hypothetical protein